MKRYVKLSVGFILLLVFQNTNSQNLFEWKGSVFSFSDSMPVPHAHVISLQSNRAATTDIAGNFSIQTQIADTILITAIGFEKMFIPVMNNHVGNIYLEENETWLDTITIRAFMSYKQFAFEFKNLNLPKEPEINLNIPEGFDLSKLKFPDDHASRVPASNELPQISFITLNLKSDKANRILRMKTEYKNNISRWNEMERKYGNDFIKSITGIEDEEEIVAFKKFCNLSHQFILESEPYTIAEVLVDCYKNYSSKINP